jgi:hypothetical protein
VPCLGYDNFDGFLKLLLLANIDTDIKAVIAVVIHGSILTKKLTGGERLTGEHNKKYLIASIWVIVIGIILLVCGLIIGGGMSVVSDITNWFEASHTLTYNVGIGLVWGGIILFIVGIFGIVTALIKGSIDKGQEKATSASH